MPEDCLTRSEKQRLGVARNALLTWFSREGRTFPWREAQATEYERICVEALLQRTRAETVSSFYEGFFEKYPDWASLAAAPVEELEDALKPIGLWQRRARSINALAKYASKKNGHFPLSESELLKVPAVGQYMANAIQLFQYGKVKPLIDVNMARFIERYLRERRMADIRYDPWLQEAASWLVRGKEPVAVNWAILDHVALTCRPRNPSCENCTLFRKCSYPRR